MPSIIEMKSISFHYPGREVFRNLSLSIEEGEILGLIGPNSSGKTTLLKLIDGILSPQHGEVLFQGQNLRSLKRPFLARQMAVVPQEMDLPFAFQVREIVLMGRAPYLSRWGWETEKDWTVVRQSMALTDVAGQEDRPFAELSQGEKQRVLLARALAQEPRVLLLDEPTSHLDLNHQVEIHELIRRLNRERKLTVLNISHDLNLAAEYCHRMVLLRQGTIDSVGTPAQVLTEENIRRVYEIQVLIERHPISGAPRVIPIALQMAETASPKRTVHIICGGGSGADSARRLLLRGYQVTLGVLNIGDTDQRIGSILGLSMALEEPFAAISGRADQANRELIRRADVVLLERFPIGRGNLANLKAALEARKEGKRVIVIQNDPREDLTGGEATRFYQELKDRGAILIPDHSRLLEAIEAPGV